MTFEEHFESEEGARHLSKACCQRFASVARILQQTITSFVNMRKTVLLVGVMLLLSGKNAFRSKMKSGATSTQFSKNSAFEIHSQIKWYCNIACNRTITNNWSSISTQSIFFPRILWRSLVKLPPHRARREAFSFQHASNYFKQLARSF